VTDDCARFGYPIAFLDRQLLLKILAKRIVEPSKILLDKRVTSVENSADGVTVHCEDSTQYQGDVVAGADGVHSIVRNEMEIC